MKEKENNKKEKALLEIDRIQKEYFPEYGKDNRVDQLKSYTPARESEEETAQVPDISFIVPIYNRASFLPKCLDSILNQTHRNIEIICVNDGSTDNSLEIIKDYAKRDPRISIVDKENGGLSSARNYGMEYTHAPLISFIDADDWIDERFAEYAFLEMNKDISLSYFCCGIQCVTNDDAFIGNIESLEALHRKIINGKQKVNEAVLIYPSHEVANKVFRRNIIEEHKISFITTPLGEDLLFFYMYCAHSQFAYYCKKRLYFYLRHVDTIINTSKQTSSRNFLVLFVLCKEIYLYFEKLGLLPAYKDVLVQEYSDCANTAVSHVSKPDKARLLVLHKAFLDILDERYFDIVAINKKIKTRPDSFFSHLVKGIFSITKKDNSKIMVLCGLKITLKKA